MYTNKLIVTFHICKKGLMYTTNFVTLTRHNFPSVRRAEFFCHLSAMIEKVLTPNFISVGQAQAELHIFKVNILDAYIRFLFANLVT